MKLLIRTTKEALHEWDRGSELGVMEYDGSGGLQGGHGNGLERIVVGLMAAPNKKS